MATFIDEHEEEEVSLEPDEELTSFTEEEVVEEEEALEEPTLEDSAEEDDLPEKYRGKSVKDIIAMHQNAEKLLGKQSSEVGELRKVVDNFIQTQTIAQQQKQAPVQAEDDLDDLDDF